MSNFDLTRCIDGIIQYETGVEKKPNDEVSIISHCREAYALRLKALIDTDLNEARTELWKMLRDTTYCGKYQGLVDRYINGCKNEI